MTVLLIDYYNTADYSIDYSNDRTADDFSIDYYDTTHHCFIDYSDDCTAGCCSIDTMGVATISRMLQNICLFAEYRSLL